MNFKQSLIYLCSNSIIQKIADTGNWHVYGKKYTTMNIFSSGGDAPKHVRNDLWNGKNLLFSDEMSDMLKCNMQSLVKWSSLAKAHPFLLNIILYIESRNSLSKGSDNAECEGGADSFYRECNVKNAYHMYLRERDEKNNC